MRVTDTRSVVKIWRSRARWLAGVLALVAAVWTSAPVLESQTQQMGPLDRILDTYVRDGFVYYRALRQERGALDSYVASLSGRSVDTASRDEQIAFWLNAYNALVLRTVINHYPLTPRSKDFPANSIRQVPGAFDRTQHRVGGRSVTLDEIEQAILSAFGDPRVFLALGRGAAGSPRLRSEAFTAVRLEPQLANVAAECAADADCLRIDRLEDRIEISAIFSWRETHFVEAYAARADPRFNQRSPLERAVLALATPHLLRMEQELVGRNTFEVQFLPFDWTLNDLTGR